MANPIVSAKSLIGDFDSVRSAGFSPLLVENKHQPALVLRNPL